MKRLRASVVRSRRWPQDTARPASLDGCEPGVPTSTPEADVAHARDVAATHRDLAAADRDRAAALRDREAQLAGGSADQRAAAETAITAAPGRGRRRRSRAESDRLESAIDRDRATGDRLAAAEDREASRRLMSAVTLSSASGSGTGNADEERLWEMSADLLAMADVDGRLRRVSNSWTKVLGFSASQLMGRAYHEFVHPDDLERTLALMAPLFAGTKQETHFDNRARTKDGSYRWLSWRARVSSDPPACYFVIRDVTGVRTSALDLNVTQELLRQGFEDAAIGMAVTRPGGAGLVRANRVMREITGRSADELAACESLADFARVEDAEALRGLLARLSVGEGEYDEDEQELVRPDGSTVWIERSISALLDPHGAAAPLFVRAVDISERKRREDLDDHRLMEAGWIRRIREAIDHDRVVLYTQPIISVRTRQIVKHELLLRMLDEHGEAVLPLEFLGTAERHGLIEELDAWVVSQAVKLAAEGEPVDVNLSAASIGNPEILRHIERELVRRKVDPSKLVFETTQAALMKNAESGEPFATRLTELGCGLAIDDFGPVDGSLTNLARYSPDYLKIDMEFVRQLGASAAAEQVVKDIVALAADVGQMTIAEGVEDEATLALLGSLGVDFAQGFHIGRPAPSVNLGASRPL
jgi:PAS domain S-box-containing protein